MAVCIPWVGVSYGYVYLSYQGWGVVRVVVVRVGTFYGCGLVCGPWWSVLLVRDTCIHCAVNNCVNYV